MSTTDAATTAEAVVAEPLSGKQKAAVATAARAFSSYGESRKVMASIAKAIVNLRLTFEKDGRPDFRGETPQYRGAIASLYEAAIADPEERESFKVAIRYWVGKEYALRVEDKRSKITKAALIKAGVMHEAPAPAPAPAPAQEPRRAASARTTTKTGVVADGHDLTPEEVLVKAEEVVMQHVTDESLGVVTTMQSIGRALGPAVAALRDDKVRDKLPGRALKASVSQVVTLALDAADLAGLDVDEVTAQWFAAHTEAVAA